MTTKLQIRLIIALLIFLGFGSAWYKHQVLGFSFVPEKRVELWTVEAKVSFIGAGDDVEVSLNLPDASKDLVVLTSKNVGVGYDFTKEKGRAVWRAKQVEGANTLYLQANIALAPADLAHTQPARFIPVSGHFEGSIATAADSLLAQVSGDLATGERAGVLLRLLNSPDHENAALLRSAAKDFGSKAKMAAALLSRGNIPARPIHGLQLADPKNSSKLQSYIEIKDGTDRILLDIVTGLVEPRKTVLAWQKNDESMLDIIGGTSSKVSFSVLEGKMAADRVAVLNGHKQESVLVDFSIYSLPIKDQNTFKLLLLIPIGALVVVILRNLVGITTSGTFMPILIALVFLQTSLLSGLGLFITVVGVGLVLRKYLTHLNLLLVPRISAVLVFVILIYVAISVISVKMNFATGLQVTFFPMIIISWTIERMSILWEEEGPADVFKQGGGSLFAASIIYFAMSNSYIGHLTYSFPELLLVVLAIILMIGSYSGYRLSELRRFEPLIKGE